MDDKLIDMPNDINLYYFKVWSLLPTNHYLVEVSKVLKTMHKTLGTSLIYSPMSPPFLKCNSYKMLRDMSFYLMSEGHIF